MAESIMISLAAARVNAGLTQKEVCEKLHVTPNTIVAWESGQSEPKISQGRALAKLYGIPLDNIIFCPENQI